MSIAAGVDFGTLGVLRITLVATNQGQLGSASPDIPFIAGRKIPALHKATDDHRRALSEAIERALGAAKVPGNQVAALAVDTTGSSVIPADEKPEPLGEYTSLRRIATRARGNP